MADRFEYQRRVREMDWEELAMLWRRIERGATPEWESGGAFEHLILRAFELDGATVRWPYEVSISDHVVEQIDGAIYAANLACLIEAKDTAAPVTVGTIAKLRQQVLRRPAPVLGLLFSRSGFTRPAVTLAQFLAPQNVLLWTGSDLAYVIERRGIVWALEAKYRHSVEYGQPEHSLQETLPR